MPPLHKSVIEIFSLLDFPQSIVSGSIAKWKRLGTTAIQPRSGRPHKVTEPGRQVLRRIVCKSCQRSAGSIIAEFQTTSGINISTNTVHWEVHAMGFHGRAAACKPSTMPSIGWSGVKHSASELRRSGNMFCGVTNHASLSGSLMDESGLGKCQQIVTCLIALCQL